MLAILKWLNNRERVSTDKIADKFGVSKRSAERYIEVLKNAEFPITYDRNRKSYIFEKEYTLGHADFTAEESLVFSLAKDLMKKDFGEETASLLSGIEKKLGFCSPGLPKHIRLSQNIQSAEVERYFKQLNEAILNCQKVEIVYDALHDKKETCRKVNPYYLFFNDGIWLLRGYCHLRKAMRTFALDKIASLKVLKIYFLPKLEISADEELAGTFGSFIEGEPVTVVLRFMREFAPFIQRKKWHPTQTVKELPNGDIEVTFRVNGLKGIKYWLYRWIPYMVIIEPKEFRKEVVGDLRRELKRLE